MASFSAFTVQLMIDTLSASTEIFPLIVMSLRIVLFSFMTMFSLMTVLIFVLPFLKGETLCRGFFFNYSTGSYVCQYKDIEKI